MGWIRSLIFRIQWSTLLSVPRRAAMTTAASIRLPLHDRHVSAGARLVSFAGWEMPVQYVGIREEHQAVRAGAGAFDVSHMGQIDTRGPEVLAFLQRLLSNDVSRLGVDQAQYGLMCREDAGVLDDVITYRLDESRYLTVTNAANHDKDLAWFRRAAADFDIDLVDRQSEYAMLAVQGPHARAIAASLVGVGQLPDRMRISRLELGGVPALVCGTGYTGEEGVEILLAPDAAGVVWDRLLAEGAVAAGLGARDTLRLEACFHLYGNDLSEDRDPIGAGLGWCCKEETGFIGAEAVAKLRASSPAERLVPFKITDRGIARAGDQVLSGGVVTSGTLSPSLGMGIGMAYLPAGRAGEGSPFQIDVRGRIRDAVVAAKPLYDPSSRGEDG